MIQAKPLSKIVRNLRAERSDFGNPVVWSTVITLSLFFAISIFTVGLMQSHEKQKSQWAAQRSTLDQFADVIAHDVSVYDLGAIERAAQIISAQSAVVEIVIYGRYQDIIHEVTQKAPIDKGDQLVPMSMPIMEGERKVGEAHFELLKSAVIHEKYRPFANATWAFIFSSFFGALVIQIYTKHFVSRPLRELQEACDRTVETGEHHSANFVASSRFGAYARSFNKMQTKLGTLQIQKSSLVSILTEEQNAIDAFLKASNSAIYVFNADGQLSMQRGEIADALQPKFDPKALANIDFKSCTQSLKDNCVPVRENGETVGYIYELESKGKSDLDVAVLFNVHSLPNDQTAVFVYDITSLRHAENAVSELQKARALAELTGGVAHDFNNILASISASAEALALDRSLKLDSEQKSMIDHCIKASAMGADLCQQLLAYSRRKVLQETSFDTGKAIEDTASFLARTVGVNYAIRTQIINSAPIFADHSMLQRSLTNLALNARNAMPNGGMIEFKVDVDLATKSVLITVFNNGPAIPPEIINRVFDPFFSTSQNSGGNGLGLSVVKGFVEQSGGTISIRNVRGGVEVQMAFPISVVAASRTVALSEDLSKEIASDTHKILLIDDNPLVLNSLSRLLRLQKHEVSTALDYAEVVEHSKSLGNFDLVITDVMMPEVDGISIARKFRNSGSNVPIIFMTGLESYQLKSEIGLLNNVYLVLKPANLAELNKVIRKIFAKQHKAATR